MESVSDKKRLYAKEYRERRKSDAAALKAKAALTSWPGSGQEFDAIIPVAPLEVVEPESKPKRLVVFAVPNYTHLLAHVKKYSAVLIEIIWAASVRRMHRATLHSPFIYPSEKPVVSQTYYKNTLTNNTSRNIKPFFINPVAAFDYDNVMKEFMQSFPEYQSRKIQEPEAVSNRRRYVI